MVRASSRDGLRESASFSGILATIGGRALPMGRRAIRDEPPRSRASV
jgi:hypothetical protein